MRPAFGARVLTVAPNEGPIDPDVSHTGRELFGLLEGRPVDDRVRVENDDVRVHSRPQHAAIRNRETRRDRGAHLADGVLEREYMLITYVPTENARIGTV